MLPLDELRQLDNQVSAAGGMEALKPIFARLNEILKEHPADLDVQVMGTDVRQRIIDKGVALRRAYAESEAPVARAMAVPAAPKAVPAPAPKPVVPSVPPLDLKADSPEPRPTTVRRAVWIGAVLGIAAWLILFVVLVQIARNRNMPSTPKAAAKPAAGTIAVNIATLPPGAAIRINGEEKCRSNCRVDLAPGNYQVTAMLDGFNPVATGVTVVPGSPINVSLSLVAQTQSIKLFTDLEGGRVILDGKPAGELQDGQLILDQVPNGHHAISVVGKMAEASFAFEGDSGQRPTVVGPIAATNILAIVVTSLGSDARVQTSAPAPLNVALNGQAMGNTGTLGLDLKNVPAGDQTLVIGDGPDQRKLVVPFGQMPSVTAFLRANVNTGILVVSTREDDVSVFLNGKEYRRKTSHGELRVQTVGNVVVSVAKPGFQQEPEQRVEVKKGEETRVAFQLRPLPRVASLQIRNGVPGTQIMLDDRAIGRVGADGTLSAANLPPGEHTIEARRDGFVPKRVQRSFRAGETLALNGVDVTLAAATGMIHIAANPPDATVTYRRADESQTHQLRDGTARLEPGFYVFTARAPNHTEKSERVNVVAGETRSIELALAREVKPPPPPAPKVARAAQDWSGWSREGGEYVRKGGNRVVVHAGELPGVITFTARLKKAGGLFRGGKLRWFVEDENGVSQFEADRKRFSAKGPGGSRSVDYGHEGDQEGEKTFTVQVEITPERIVNRMRVGNTWTTVDSRPNPGGGEGKFGFVIPGGDEIAISDFRFAPK